jgi:hypothetical protein
LQLPDGVLTGCARHGTGGKEAQYIEKGGPDSVIPIRSQHAVLELMSFTPGKP